MSRWITPLNFLLRFSPFTEHLLKCTYTKIQGKNDTFRLLFTKQFPDYKLVIKLFVTSERYIHVPSLPLYDSTLSEVRTVTLRVSPRSPICLFVCKSRLLRCGDSICYVRWYYNHVLCLVPQERPLAVLCDAFVCHKTFDTQ